MKLLEKTINKIDSLDKNSMEEAQNRLDNLTKPPGSLGKLEELAVQLAGITGEMMPDIKKKVHILFAADHGVVAEGVSAFSQEVTTAMVRNFLNGGAAINVLANQVGAEVKIVDIGVKDELEADDLIVNKIKAGTDNFAQGPAMSRSEAKSSIEVGIKIAKQAIDQGADLLATGEMGIGNTTASSAIVAAITDFSLAEVVGYGTGIDETGLENKKEVIAKALELNQPDSKDGVDVLAKVGGLEIGGMAGVMLAAAAEKTPVIVDGLISGAAALIAYQLEPNVVNYLIPSHNSVEPGHSKVYQRLGLEAMLDLEMRLGEGTGAVLAMELVESATRVIKEMATFDELTINN